MHILKLKDAKNWDAAISQMNQTSFDSLLESWKSYSLPEEDAALFKDSEKEVELRNAIVDVARQFDGDKKSYLYDLEIGIKLYQELSPVSGLFPLVEAADDDRWRFISCRIFPDLTYLRWSTPGKSDTGRINSKRFYSHPRRIWLKTLWWFVYLAWQGDVESTRKVLLKLSGDVISDFIERPNNGYRVEYMRQLLATYSRVQNRSTELFNQIQKLNLVKFKSIEPELSDGGNELFAKTVMTELNVKWSEDE